MDYHNSSFGSGQSFAELQPFPSESPSTAQNTASGSINSNSTAQQAHLPNNTFGHVPLSVPTVSTTNTAASQCRKRNMDGTMSSSPTNKKFRRGTSSQPDESEPPPSAA